MSTCGQGKVVHFSMRRDSKDVAASHLHTAVAAAKTLRRHTLRLLLRQQRRCGVTLAHCCCGSRDVAASHSQSAVAAAETLRRRTRRLLLRQQRPCSVTLCDHCSGSTAGAQRQRQRRGHLAGCSMNSVGGMHLESAFAEKVV